MQNAQEILLRDLMTYEAMVNEMDLYLASEATHWTLVPPGLPKLTIGGCLMRQHRLLALKSQFHPEEQVRLDTAVNKLKRLLSEQVVRFEQRTYTEIRARLSEWIAYLGVFSRHGREYYARVVDTRVVLQAMINKLQQPPYRLDKKVIEELATLDKNLKGRWQPGSFVWESVWKPAYPEDTYWWLYGSPKQEPETTT
ncbi:MAG: hypothetical protein D6706_01770 [Chloroflexi bacterium]|nr:MAG: hypothetical protein D6706_01770 [Chloroflexota bacterium]